MAGIALTPDLVPNILVKQIPAADGQTTPHYGKPLLHACGTMVKEYTESYDYSEAAATALRRASKDAGTFSENALPANTGQMYHRTITACVSCRRRKRRCLLVQSGHGQGCKNCIRLREKCIFMSVGQERMEASVLGANARFKTSLNMIVDDTLPDYALEFMGSPGLTSLPDHYCASDFAQFFDTESHLLSRRGFPSPGQNNVDLHGKSKLARSNKSHRPCFLRDAASSKMQFISGSQYGARKTWHDNTLEAGLISRVLANREDSTLDANTAYVSLNNFAMPRWDYHQAQFSSTNGRMASQAMAPMAYPSEEWLEQKQQGPCMSTSIPSKLNQASLWPEGAPYDDPRCYPQPTYGDRAQNLCELKLNGELYNRRGKTRIERGHVLDDNPLVNVTYTTLIDSPSRCVAPPTQHLSDQACEFLTVSLVEHEAAASSTGSDRSSHFRSGGHLSEAPKLFSYPWYSTSHREDDAKSRDQCFYNYIRHLRNLLIEGWPEEKVLGPARTPVTWLFTSDTETHESLSLTQWIAGIISTFEVLGVPEKIGLTILYTRYFKWFVTRSLHDYYRIPYWLRPTPIQMAKTHDIWIDLIPWPQARDTITQMPHAIKDVYDVISRISGDLYLKWPFGPSDLIDVDESTGTFYPSGILEQYALDLQNWSLHSSVVSRYPLLVGRVQESRSYEKPEASGMA